MENKSMFENDVTLNPRHGSKQASL